MSDHFANLIRKPYLIFTFDGGGIRGILTATILERLFAFRPEIFSLVDLYAGTSTGSIIASSLAAGLTPLQIKSAYESLAPHVFRANWMKRLPFIGNIFHSKYHNSSLRAELIKVFGDRALGELPHKILIAAFDIDGPVTSSNPLRSWRPKFFNNFQASDANIKIVDAILCSTAAPTYFPSWSRFIDGGVAANNPSMAALAQAIDPQTGGQLLENLLLLSFSTGQSPAFITRRSMPWGWIQWVPRLIDLMLDGNISIADYQVKRLLGTRYWRINPIYPEPIAMDDIRTLEMLKRLGSDYDPKSVLGWLDLYLPKHSLPKPEIWRGRF